VETATTKNAPTQWRIKLSIIPIVTAFLPYPNSSEFISEEIGNSSTVFFAAVETTIKQQFERKSLTPAFICVLHTFGRDLKFNPHIHVIVTEGGLTTAGKWQNMSFFPFPLLRKAFQAILLNMLHEKLGDSFKKTKAEIYKIAENGFYVRAPKSKGNIKNAVKYIGRYLGRPVIASSRITNYDGKNVTFHYNRHEDDKKIEETIPANEFIERVVIHIPPKYFNMIRYYGIYAQKLVISEKIGKLLKTENRRLSFRDFLFNTFGIDPLLCKHCGQRLWFLKLTHTPENAIFLRSRASPVI
jgi:hypothetical protein